MRLGRLLRTKRREILRIAGEHGAHNVRVFGSAARGDARDDSDIDFLVEFEPGTSLLTHADLIVALEDLLVRHVDVAPEKTLKERLRDRVLSEALPL
jgi:predicted nucleotidyltransferase